jgi:hypothetical protein
VYFEYYSLPRLRGGCSGNEPEGDRNPLGRTWEMGVAAGGKIQHEIQRTGLKWDHNAVTEALHIRMLSPELFEKVTGRQMSFKPPISMAQCLPGDSRVPETQNRSPSRRIYPR